MTVKDVVLSFDNMFDAYNKTHRSKSKYKIQAIDFYRNETANLLSLREELQDKTYSPLPHNRFYVYEPKIRLIYSPAYRDKIVHHAVNNILRDIVEPTFIHDSYSCIRNKGTQKALRRLLHFTRSATDVYSDPYVVKVDLKKFFYSIDHDVLCNVIEYSIKDPFLRWILKLYVTNSPEEKGIPLGNLLSQILVNIMMNLFDQWCKRELKLRYYLRYSDDIIAIVDGKENARIIMNKMKEFLSVILLLETHEKKTLIHPLSQGIKSFGFRINPRGIFMTQETRRRVKRKLKATNSQEIATSLIQWLQISNSRRDIHRLVFSIGKWGLLYKGNKFKKAFPVQS